VMIIRTFFRYDQNNKNENPNNLQVFGIQSNQWALTGSPILADAYEKVNLNFNDNYHNALIKT